MASKANPGAAGEHASFEAVDRAARVLNSLAARPVASTLAEIARGADLSKPTTFRILATLIAEGLAAQNTRTGSYRLGATPLRHATNVLQRVAVREPALEAMRAIRDVVKESVVLSVREGEFRYNIESVDAENAIGQAQQIGVAIPLYAGAASRVFLAAMTPDELLDYLDRTTLTRFSDATITDRDALIAEVETIRARGYGISHGEFTAAGYAVARAITDGDGVAVAAIHVSAPESRFSPAVQERFVAALQEAVEAIQAKLVARGVSADP